jgi:hypothetical protein
MGTISKRSFGLQSRHQPQNRDLGRLTCLVKTSSGLCPVQLPNARKPQETRRRNGTHLRHDTHHNTRGLPYFLHYGARKDREEQKGEGKDAMRGLPLVGEEKDWIPSKEQNEERKGISRGAFAAFLR